MELLETINTLQQQCDKLYEAYGATEEVINLQVLINTLCSKNDITNPNEEKLYENFVQ